MGYYYGGKVILKMAEWIYARSNMPVDKSCVGNKAFNLFKALDYVQIPEFITLSSSEMMRVLSFECNAEINDRLRVLWANKLSLMEHIDEIHREIMNLIIPKTYLELLLMELKEHNICVPYSVRSSSIYEDMNNNSAPGVFESFLNVSEDELANTIKKCWASNFSMRSVFYFGNEFKSFDDIRMGVIIQNMQPGDCAGIMFTVNPVTAEDELVVEITERYSDGLTDGAVAGKRLLIEPEQRKVKNGGAVDKKVIDLLADLVLDLRKVFRDNLDIEWCIKDDLVYLLQVRPVSIVCEQESREEKENRIFSISEIDLINCKGTGLEKRVLRWRGKKQYFNRSCERVGVRHLEWYFVENYNKEMDGEIEKYISRFKGEYVTLAVNETLIDVVKKRDEVLSFMKEYGEVGEKNVISFRDIPMNEVSVISNVVDGDIVYLEAIDGIMKGLKTGELKGSSYQVNADGTIVKKQEYHEPQKYMIEFPSGNTFLVPNNNHSFKGYEEQFLHIADLTRRLYKDGQRGAVEWWICGNEVFAADISLSEMNINFLDDNTTYFISKGRISGSAYCLDEDSIEELNKISFGTAISVDKIEIGAISNRIFLRLKQELEQYGQKDEVVLIVRKPYLGIAPLLNYVSGVVFEEASMLCHLSVMLREKGIPAVVVGDKFNRIKNGERIMYDNSFTA